MGLLQGSHHIDIQRALRAKRLEIYLNFACILAAVWQPERNSETLIGCPPDTEIFSKRRKIYTFCVEDMSLKLKGNPSCHLKLGAHDDLFAYLKMHTSKVETIIMISYVIGKIYFLRHKIAIHFWYYHLSRHVPNFLNF